MNSQHAFYDILLHTHNTDVLPCLKIKNIIELPFQTSTEMTYSDVQFTSKVKYSQGKCFLRYHTISRTDIISHATDSNGLQLPSQEF